MDTFFYYITSYLRILPIKGIQYIYNKYNGQCFPARRMLETTKLNNIYNHVSILYSDPTEIKKNFLLGTGYNASNYSTLETYKIKTIINVTDNIPNYFQGNSDIIYHNIPILDDSNSHLTDYISDLIRFIDENPINDDNQILIHCYMGSSRSASVMIILFMYLYKMTYDESLNLIRQKRPIVNLNVNFITDIQQWDLERVL